MIHTVLYDKTFLGRHNIHTIYSPHIGSPWQTKIRILPKSNLVNQWVLLGSLTKTWERGFFQKQKWLKDSWIDKVHSSPMSDSSQRNKPGAHCITCGQLSKVGQHFFFQVVSASFRHLSWSLLLSGSLSVLRIFAAWSIWERISVVLFVVVCYHKRERQA